MKFAVLVFVSIGLMLPETLVRAADVTLSWDPPPTDYGGFMLGYGTSSGQYEQILDVGKKTAQTIVNLTPGQTYYFAVKTYDAGHTLESPYSNELRATVPGPDTIPPASPKNVQILR